MTHDILAENPSQQDSRKDEQGSEDQEAACQEQAATDAAEDISLHGVPGAANSYASVAKQQAGQEGVFDGSEKPASRDQLLEIEDALRAELDALLHQDAQHRTLDAEQTNYGQLVGAICLGFPAQSCELQNARSPGLVLSLICSSFVRNPSACCKH